MNRPANRLLAAGLAMMLAGCGGGALPDEVEVDVEDFGSPAGYWEGQGQASETPLDDGVRTLNRSVDFEFWFALDANGTGSGEITLTYDALLTVVGLPSLSVPAGGFGSVSFDPEVGGKLTDEDPTRIFPLVGLRTDAGLVLAMIPGDEPDPLEFTIQADPGVSAGLSLGGADLGVDGQGSGEIVQIIDMRPFSPFGDQDIAEVEKRPGGPYAAHFEIAEDTWAIEWSAVQQSSDVQSVEITDEMRDALDALGSAGGD
ncbi:MAG: hypothetical protein ACRDGV_06940 [Candidatus Limnocylindria bacterium]